MANMLTRIRLYAAQNNASYMGLESTAGRLKALREQLAVRHETDKAKKDLGIWAQAKIRETRTALETEARELDDRLAFMNEDRKSIPEAEREIDDAEKKAVLSEGMNTLGKGFASMVAMTTLADPIRRLFTQDSTIAEMIVKSAVISTAIIALLSIVFKAVDMLVSRDLGKSVCSIRDALEFSSKMIGKPKEGLVKSEG
jgi:hypothetical protein